MVDAFQLSHSALYLFGDGKRKEYWTMIVLVENEIKIVTDTYSLQLAFLLAFFVSLWMYTIDSPGIYSINQNLDLDVELSHFYGIMKTESSFSL